MRGACWHTAPDGRRFVIFTAQCICAGLGPCWQARCECGTELAAHNYGPDTVKRDALAAMAESHPSCSASRELAA